MRVREDDYCFACGSRNPVGLRLVFYERGDVVETTFVPALEHQGFVGIIHGGLVSLVLDEAMAKLLYLRGIEALTCDLAIRLREAARVGEPLAVRASLVVEHKRVLELQATATSGSGGVVATARAKFLRVGDRA